LEICFHKRQVSFLVIKTVKCKRGNSVVPAQCLGYAAKKLLA